MAPSSDLRAFIKSRKMREKGFITGWTLFSARPTIWPQAMTKPGSPHRPRWPLPAPPLLWALGTVETLTPAVMSRTTELGDAVEGPPPPPQSPAEPPHLMFPLICRPSTDPTPSQTPPNLTVCWRPPPLPPRDPGRVRAPPRGTPVGLLLRLPRPRRGPTHHSPFVSFFHFKERIPQPPIDPLQLIDRIRPGS